nr:MAG TPA: protein of unknown function DUF3458 [Caudoviricetes sp.]
MAIPAFHLSAPLLRGFSFPVFHSQLPAAFGRLFYWRNT